MKTYTLLFISLFTLFSFSSTSFAQIPTTGLRLHLKADAGTSTTTPGQKISQWNDQSGNGFHAIESNPTWQPTYVTDAGFPAIRFTPAAPTSMNLPDHATLGLTNSEIEIFIVTRSSSSATQFAFAGGINYTEIQYNGANGMRFIPKAGLIVDNPADVDNGAFHLINAIATNSTAQLGVDGVFESVNKIATHDINVAFNLGTRDDGSYRLDGDIAEIIVYNRKLTSLESMQVSEYLKNKYSTPFTAYAAPATPASGLNFTGVTQSSMNVNVTKGSGSHRVIIARKGGAVTVGPTVAITYTGSTTFGAGDHLGDGNYVIYAGTEGTSTALSGLEFNESYHIAVYEYYLVGGFPTYGTASVSNQTTVNLTQASSLTILSRTADTFTGGVTAGSGTHRIIVARAGSAVDQGPTNGVTYTGNASFGAGTQIGTGNYVIYAGTDGSSYNLNGLSGSSVYHLAAFEYVLYDGVPKYQSVSPPVISGITYPSISASALQFSSVGLDQMTVSFTAGNGQNRIVIARETQAVSVAPGDGQSYSANATFGSGQNLGSDNYVVYNGSGNSFTLSGLTNSTTYYFAVYEYNEYSGTINFKTTSPATGSQSTTVVPYPTISNANFGVGTGTSREINGTVNPNNYETTVQIIYGTSEGALSQSTTPQSIGAGASDVAVTIDVTGLQTGELYFAKIKATNIRGSVESALIKFAPLTLTSLRAWFRADVATLTNGGTILSTFTDLSGLGNDLGGNGAPYVASGINGKPSVTFSSINDGFGFAQEDFGLYNTNLEIIVVFETSDNSLQYIFSEGYTNAGGGSGLTGNGDLVLNNDIFNDSVGVLVNMNGFIETGTKGQYSNGSTNVLHYKSAANRIDLRINNDNLSSKVGNGRFYTPWADRTLNLNISRGRSQYFKGQIAEILFYNAALSVEQRHELSTYLSQRYGVSVYTPSVPTVASSNLQFSAVLPTSFSVSMDAGNGAERLIVARLSSSPKTAPINGVTYVASSNFGSGSDLGNGNHVVGTGTGTSIAINGLVANTEYAIDVYEYNFMELDPQYMASSPNSATQSTQSVPLPSVSLFRVENPNTATPIVRTLIDPKGFEVTAQVYYGTSATNLNLSTSPQVIGSQASVQSVGLNLSGISENTTYYYKVVVTNVAGSVESEVASFTNNSTVGISSLSLWVSGDAATNTVNSGDPVTNWGNQAGKALKSTQINSANAPVRITDSGVSFLRFDGVSDFLELAIADTLGLVNSDYEIFIVARSSNTNIGFLMGGTVGNFELHTRPSGGVGTRFIPRSGILLDNPINSTDGNFHVFNAKATDTQTLIRLDGNTSFTNQNGRSSVASQLILGSRRDGSYYFDGDIAEILIYNSALTESQTWEIHSYLATKYGILLTNFRSPSVQASEVSFSNTSETGVSVSVSSGNGSNRIMIARESSTVAVPPVNGVNYNADPHFGSGSTTGTGNFVIYNGTDSEVFLTGLSSNTSYVIDVYEYNLAGTWANYLSDSPATATYNRYDESEYAGKIVYIVNTLNDNNTGTGKSGSLRWILNQINTQSSDSSSLIDLRYAQGTITLTADLPPINYNTILLGAGKENTQINGANLYRPFFVGAGTAPFSAENPAKPNVKFESLTVLNGRGKGGNGSSGGGGAAGMGGAMFINKGNVTISDSRFSGNQAIGGNGSTGQAGSGGGFSGDGLGGTAGSSGYLGGALPAGAGQNGGIGAGGAGGDNVGGNGGFGAGGGGTLAGSAGSVKTGGNGGFGGAGGGPSFGGLTNQGVAGFGAGQGIFNGVVGSGGGGAGLGGAIFNKSGNLILTNTEFEDNVATGGTGNDANSGTSYAGALFNYQGAIITTSVTYTNNTSVQHSSVYDYSNSGQLKFVEINTAKSLSQTSALFRATLNTVGYSGTYRFKYGTDRANLNLSTSNQNYDGLPDVQLVTESVGSLDLTNQLYISAEITNSLGTFVSDTISIFFNDDFPNNNLKLWLNAGRGVQTGAGSIVTLWEDYSGSTNNATQSASGYHPMLVANALNGEPVIRFNGSSSYLVIQNAANLALANSDYEIFMVAKSSSPEVQFLWSGGISEQEIHLNGSSGVRFLSTSGKTIDAGNSGQFTNGQAFLVNVKATDTNGSIRINNNLLGFLNGNTHTAYANEVLLGIRTGGTFFYNGDIAEIIAYNKALSVQQRDSVNSYLATKYGITLETISEPTISANNLDLLQRQSSSLQFSFTKGNGARRVVLAKANSAVDAIPADQTFYSANAAFGSGTELGTGNFVVYSGADSVLTVSGLTAATTYHFAVFEYNGVYEADYLTSSSLTFSGRTLNQIPETVASSSLKLNGSDEVVTIPHDAAFNSDAITMEMWFKPQNVGVVPFLISKGAEELEIHLVNSNRSVRFIPTTFVYIDSPVNSFEFDQWNHIAVAYKPSESLAKMWINGIEVAVTNNGGNPLSHPLKHTSNAITLGQRVNSLPFTGELDEVRIWNDVRTTEEIREYQFSSIPSDFVNLVTYHQFNEGTGTTTIDAASGLNGTLSNFEFDSNNGWRNSGIPFGSGTFTASDLVTSGTVNATGLDITLTENFDNAVSVVAKQFTVEPLVGASGNTLNLNNPYWVIETSQNAGAFEASLTFTVSSSFVNTGSSSPNQFKLYSRPFGSDGAWSVLKSTAASVTSSTVTFDGVSQFGQFVLARDFTLDFQANSGNALLFDGTNDFVSIPLSSGLTSTKMTIEFWFKWNRSGTAVDFVTSRASEEWEIHLGAGSNGIRFIPRPGVYIDTPSEAIIPGEWTHLAVVYDPSVSLGKIYVNGADATGNVIGSLASPLLITSNSLNLGHRQISGNLHFAGEMDEFRVWNSARTQQQIQENYNRTLPDGYYSDLVMYFQFNEGTGTSTSEIQSGLTGTLTNFDFNQNSGWVNSFIPITQEITTDITLTGTEGWRLLASPISSNSYSPLLSSIWTQGFEDATTTNGTSNVYLWPNNSTGNSSSDWTPLTAMETPMQAGSGVLVYVYSDDNGPAEGNAGFPKTISISGTETVEDKNLSSLLNQNVGGWTLLGNPFSKDINWNNLSRNGLSGSVYVWDNEANEWRSWNGTTGGLTNGHVGAFNGFFVETTVQNPTFTIPQNARVDGNNGFVGKASTQQHIALSLELKSESGLTSHTWFEFTEDGQTGKDDGDSYKLAPLSYEWAQLASVSKSILGEDILLDVNRLPVEQNQWNIPLAISSTETGLFELSIKSNSLPDGWKVRLWDSFLETSIDLNEEFEFELEEVVSTESNSVHLEKIETNETVQLTVKNKLEKGEQSLGQNHKKVANSASQKSKTKIKNGSEIQSGSRLNGRYVLQITKVDFSDNINAEIPAKMELSQNYPNPFNPSTTIQFGLPEVGFVQLQIFDVTGRLVQTLVNESRAAGYHQVQFNASGLASGMYIYRLSSSQGVVTKKLMLIK